MPDVNFVMRYVEDVARSASFYAGFAGEAGRRSLVEFRDDPGEAGADAGPVAARRRLARRQGLPSAGAVEAAHARWSAAGAPIAQTPMGCGYSFVALDPDGHRLRAFAPPAR